MAPEVEWLPGATMSGDGTRFLFVLQTSRHPAQLAAIEIQIESERGVGRHAAETALARLTIVSI